MREIARHILAVSQQTQLVGDITATGNDLADTIKGTAQAAKAIAASAHEQSIVMDQIAHAMGDINQMTNQFVAGAQQSQGAAEGVRELAERFQGLIAVYCVTQAGRAMDEEAVA